MNAAQALIKYLESLGVDFDAEEYWGWYWIDPKGEADHAETKGHMTKELAAEDYCKKHGIETMVIRAEPEIWGVNIIVAGSLTSCLNYMRARKIGSVDLMYPNGQMASYKL